MKNPSKQCELPSSGELLGFIANHLGLRENVGTDRTTQRVFQGERVQPTSLRSVVIEVVSALLPEEQSKPTSRTALRDGLATFVLEMMQSWDHRRARLHVDVRAEHLPHAFFPFLRLTALDLGLRVGAHAWMFGLMEPSFAPNWSFEDGFGRVLDEQLAKSTLGSRTQFATVVDVSANTMSAWSRCESFPSSINIERMAIELADTSSSERVEVEGSLRLQLLFCWARKTLSEVLGAAVAADLIRGMLWTASHVWRIGHENRTDRRTPGLIEVIHRGAQSRLGAEAAVFVSMQAPNAFMAADLRALPGEWTPRLRWWFPLMQSESVLAVQSRRFFPSEDFDFARTARAELERASTPDALVALAYVTMSGGDFAQAARLWERASLLEPQVAMHHYNFAMSHVRAHADAPHALVRALDSCRIAAGLDAQFFEARIEIAGLLSELGRHEEALETYAAVKDLAPSSVRLEFDWGHTLMTLGRDLEAAKHYEVAVELDPQYVDAWTNLCFVSERAGKKREARVAARRAAFLGDPIALHMLDKAK